MFMVVIRKFQLIIVKEVSQKDWSFIMVKISQIKKWFTNFIITLKKVLTQKDLIVDDLRFKIKLVRS